MDKTQVDKIWEDAKTGVLQCPKCNEDICYEWEEHTIKDYDCEECALFQPNDIVEYGTCFRCSLDEEE